MMQFDEAIARAAAINMTSQDDYDAIVERITVPNSNDVTIYPDDVVAVNVTISLTSTLASSDIQPPAFIPFNRPSSPDVETTSSSSDQSPFLFLLVLLPIAALVGSALTYLAVRWDPRLRHMTYYFMTSLASLHAVMAFTVIPSALHVTWQGSFQCSDALCKLWITSDLFFCNNTCLHLAFIGMDSFLRLKERTLPTSRHVGGGGARRHVTGCGLALWLGAPWMVSFVQSIAQLMLSQAEPDSRSRDGLCFVTDKNFVLLGALFSYVIPASVAVMFAALCRNEILALKAGSAFSHRSTTTGSHVSSCGEARQTISPGACVRDIIHVHGVMTSDPWNDVEDSQTGNGSDSTSCCSEESELNIDDNEGTVRALTLTGGGLIGGGGGRHNDTGSSEHLLEFVEQVPLSVVSSSSTRGQRGRRLAEDADPHYQSVRSSSPARNDPHPDLDLDYNEGVRPKHYRSGIRTERLPRTLADITSSRGVTITSRDIKTPRDVTESLGVTPRSRNQRDITEQGRCHDDGVKDCSDDGDGAVTSYESGVTSSCCEHGTTLSTSLLSCDGEENRRLQRCRESKVQRRNTRIVLMENNDEDVDNNEDVTECLDDVDDITTYASNDVPRDESLRHEMSLVSMTRCLLVIYVLLWLPLPASNVVYGICRSCRGDVTFVEVMTFKWLAYSTAALWAVSCAVLSEPLRQAYWSLLTLRHCRLSTSSLA